MRTKKIIDVIESGHSGQKRGEGESLPPILEALDESYWNDFWEYASTTDVQPEREIFLAWEICGLYPNVASGSTNVLKAAVEWLDSWGIEIDSEIDTDLSDVDDFVELSPEVNELIQEMVRMSDYLLGLSGHEIINFDVPSGFLGDDDDDQYGYSNNEWAIGALLRDYSDHHDDEVENLSLITDAEMDLLIAIGLIAWKALNPAPELINMIREFEPRLREVYELNNFANNGDETAAPEYAERFMKSEKIFIRSLVSSSDQVSEDHLRRCANDDEPFVRMELTTNPKTPTDLLIQLLGDEVEEVREKAEIPLAKRPDVPVEVLEKLAMSKNPWVRSSVASHPSSTAEIKALAALSN